MPTLEQAVLNTVAYADIFQYPLTRQEIHRYLIAVKATVREVDVSLQRLTSVLGRLDYREGYYTLPGRNALRPLRQQRREVSAGLWPRALHYGRWIGRLPFVRMVAVTGSLAMDNTGPTADLDYLVITQAGRLWLARAMVILLVRWAAHQGMTICPNYFLSENALAITEQNLFTAHELAQMVPVCGLRTFACLQQLNPWVETFLPNAFKLIQPVLAVGDPPNRFQRLVEPLLSEPMFSRVERWEMGRKIKKFAPAMHSHPESVFNADCCKGHFDDHAAQVMAAFAERSSVFEEDLLWPKSF